MGDSLATSAQEALARLFHSQQRTSASATLQRLLNKKILLPGTLLASLLLLYWRNMSFRQELDSWLWIHKLDTAPVPLKGDKAPSTAQIELPCGDGKPAILAFLRHCGCPFAEKTFRKMRDAAEVHPEIHYIAISHSNKQSTDKWLEAVGGPGKVGVVVDANRTLYAHWGLGVASWWHVLSPWSMLSVFRLAREENIKNRPTESGHRFQTSGAFAVSGDGTVTWGNAAQSADEVPDFQVALRSLK